MNLYRVEGKQLVICDVSENETYRGTPEGYAVIWADSVPDSSDGLVLYEPYPPDWQERQNSGFQNLVRVNSRGEILWRAELPSTGSTYISAKVSSKGLQAQAPSYNVQLDLQTGTIINSDFTK